MKIVHIVLGKANPNRMNGVNRVVHFLASAQSKAGLNVEVWGLSSNKEIDPTVERAYQLKIFINGSKKISSKLLKSNLREEKEVVYHLHGGFIPVFAKVAKEIRKAGTEYIFTPHGCYSTAAMSRNSFKKKLYFNFFDKKLLKKAKVVQCLGYQEEYDLRQLVSKIKHELVPNGQEFIPVLKKEKEYEQGLIFGFCGRLDRFHKGLDLLIDGYIKFKTELKHSAKLWIIGDGPYKKEMETKLEEAGLMVEVTFWGAKYGTEKFKLIAGVDAFFHTSRHEGLPTAVLEACMIGVPCAVTPQTSFDYFLEDNRAGWRVRDLSTDAVYQTMQVIVSDAKDDEIIKKGENAREMMRKFFSWDIIAKKIQPLYGPKELFLIKDTVPVLSEEKINKEETLKLKLELGIE